MTSFLLASVFLLALKRYWKIMMMSFYRGQIILTCPAIFLSAPLPRCVYMLSLDLIILRLTDINGTPGWEASELPIFSTFMGQITHQFWILKLDSIELVVSVRPWVLCFLNLQTMHERTKICSYIVSEQKPWIEN